MEHEQYKPNDSHIRVATICPEVSLADVPTNIDRITELYGEASKAGASVVAFPELSLTGYTIGDLVQQTTLLRQTEVGLDTLAKLTKGQSSAMVIGIPLQIEGNLFNCAAVLANGEVMGVVPKSNLPTYNEFYEDRWYQTWDQPNIEIELNDSLVPFGTDILFDIAGVKVGIEICEDLWVAQPPSGRLAEMGAQLIVNPSASPEQIGKASYRRELVRSQSGRLIAGYLYAGCDVSESTAEIVMGGHQIIAANGQISAEKERFSKQRILFADIDIEHLEADRRKQHMSYKLGALVIKTETSRGQKGLLEPIERNPFIPSESEEARLARFKDAVEIQAYGLATRMQASHQDKLVLGLSGGLDSTLALLVACEAADILHKKPTDMISTLTMPGLASSDTTQTNAQLLAEQLGVPNTMIPISELAETELRALKHTGDQDITYENVQARARTSLLFNYANQHHAIVVGTGDLSEIALGWNTYNGDQQSHYNVNASIPKTLVKHLVGYLKDQPKYQAAQKTLEDILSTPISPELTSTSGSDITQNTEDIIGPYELHDFFLYHLIRWGDSPAKIRYLAQRAFSDKYDVQTVNGWLRVFIERFSQNQFKRENMPNGPKVGSVSLSPRGDWRMPPDLHNAALWD